MIVFAGTELRIFGTITRGRWSKSRSPLADSRLSKISATSVLLWTGASALRRYECTFVDAYHVYLVGSFGQGFPCPFLVALLLYNGRRWHLKKHYCKYSNDFIGFICEIMIKVTRYLIIPEIYYMFHVSQVTLWMLFSALHMYCIILHCTLEKCYYSHLLGCAFKQLYTNVWY